MIPGLSIYAKRRCLFMFPCTLGCITSLYIYTQGIYSSVLVGIQQRCQYRSGPRRAHYHTHESAQLGRGRAGFGMARYIDPSSHYDNQKPAAAIPCLFSLASSQVMTLFSTHPAASTPLPLFVLVQHYRDSQRCVLYAESFPFRVCNVYNVVVLPTEPLV